VPPPNVVLWFRGCSRNNQLEDFAEGFGTLGYRLVNSDAFEREVIKVAIYANRVFGRFGDWQPTHIARQIPSLNGLWHSRIGRQCCDISHTLDALYGTNRDSYGEVRMVLARRVTPELRALERLAREQAEGGPMVI
jgi:hypothetical protein